MTSNICILGSKGSVGPRPFEMTSEEFLSKCGSNTGNLLFQYAVMELFDGTASHIGVDIPYRHDSVNGKFSHLVLPCANFINPNFDLTGLVNYLEKVKIPIVPVGLGVQADNLSRTFLKRSDLKPSIVRLLEIFDKSAPIIFVRGHYTLETLVSLGFSRDRVVVSGCPSNFIGTSSHMRLGFQKRLKVSPKAMSILVTGDEIWPKDSRKREIERLLIDLLQMHGGIYLVQSVKVLVDQLMGLYERDLSDEFKDILSHIGFKGTSEEVSRFFRLYPSIDSWMFGIQPICLSLGLRLHGNMCSLQCGIPSIWIYHDSRTQELCESMALPSLPLARARLELESGNLIETATSLFAQQVDTYFLRRSDLFHELSSHLQSLGIEIKQSCGSIAS